MWLHASPQSAQICAETRHMKRAHIVVLRINESRMPVEDVLGCVTVAMVMAESPEEAKIRAMPLFPPGLVPRGTITASDCSTRHKYALRVVVESLWEEHDERVKMESTVSQLLASSTPV